MDKNRIKVHNMLSTLVDIQEPDGDDHVYFNPPENIKIKYPAIIYSRNSIDNSHADDLPYLQNMSYQVTVVGVDRDSPISNKLSKMKCCRYNRSYIYDNLNHDVFTLYY